MINPLHLLLGRAVSMALYMHSSQVIPPVLSTECQREAVVDLKRRVLTERFSARVTQAILSLYNLSPQLGRGVSPLRT